MGLFTNGNARVTRLIICQLLLSAFTMIIVQVQGFLPSLDFIGPKALKITAFTLSVLLSINEAFKAFFNKTATLLNNHDVPPVIPPPGSTEIITKP